MITDLLNYLSSIGWIQYQSICELHKPCMDNRSCPARSKCLVVNFDIIKDNYCKGGKLKASVDAIYNGNNLFSLIEIKGWVEYIKHNPISEQNIEIQIERYNLDKKLKDSLEILLAISANKNIEGYEDLKIIPTQYLIVTDISLTHNPLDKLAENLTFLATFSSPVDLCWRKTEEYIYNLQPNDFSKFLIEGPYLISCKEIDKYLSK